MIKQSQPDKIKRVMEYLVMIAGSAIYAAALVIFIRPAGIPLGGVTGIALILDYKFSLPVGIMIVILNIPLFIVSFRSIGRRFLIRTIIITVSSSVFIDFFSLFKIVYTGDKLLNILYGGVLMGAGMGLIFSRGATSGGTEIMSKLINRKKPHISIGNINLVINIIVIGAAAIIYRSPEAALYAIVIQYISSTVLDSVLNGIDNSCAAFIVTSKPEEVAKSVLDEMNRGVTAMPAKGMYTGAQRTMLFCAVRNHEVKYMQNIINKADDGAFMIVMNTREVNGEGFKRIGG